MSGEKMDFNSNSSENNLSVFVNQAGFLPGGEKYAVLSCPSPSFCVVDAGGLVRFSGKAVPFGWDAASGETLYRADFSSLTSVGRFRVECENGFSQPFSIARGVYSGCFDSCMKAFYFQRCGCGLEEKYAGKWHHGKCHCAPSRIYGDPSAVLDLSGGWHDAGDYGKYSTAAAVTLAHLLYAWEMFPEAFERQSINIPQKPSSMADVLIECRYELEWLLKMQQEGGGVYHKVTEMLHPAFVMPEDDNEPTYAMPVSSSATADFAAAAALASAVYEKYDRPFSETLLKAALNAYSWLESNPDFLGFKNPAGCNTGSYGEHGDRDNRFWAAAELYHATGDKKYLLQAERLMREYFPKTDFGFSSVGGLGVLSLALTQRDNAELFAQLKGIIVSRAEELERICSENAWGVSLKQNQYFWGSNMAVLVNGMIFLIADYVEGSAGAGRFHRYASMQLNYLLGTNATGYSFVTGIGERHVNNLHHRAAFADGVDECIPGFVSGGPNSRLNDDLAKRLIPAGTPPMKCFADVTECYSLNETAIYWNSPAVFLLAGLQD